MPSVRDVVFYKGPLADEEALAKLDRRLSKSPNKANKPKGIFCLKIDICSGEVQPLKVKRDSLPIELAREFCENV